MIPANAIIVPPDRIHLVYESDGQTLTCSLDVCEAQLAMDEFVLECQSSREVVERTRSWIKEQGHDLTFAQAYVATVAISKAFEEFKKKLPDGLMSPPSSRSTRKRSRERVSKRSRPTSHEFERNGNSEQEPQPAA